MHDQKFDIFFTPRPEDGLHGSNETKKCEIGQVVFSNVHFKVFKSSFIYIIDENLCNIASNNCILYNQINK